MIEELSQKPLEICVFVLGTPPFPHIAYCLDLQLIGEGQSDKEAVSVLRRLVEIQCCSCQNNGTRPWLALIDHEWQEYCTHSLLGKPEATRLDVPGRNNDETIRLSLNVRTTRQWIHKSHAWGPWPSKHSLAALKEILNERGISCISYEGSYVHLLGHWQNTPDAPLMSYPFRVPSDMSVSWYHLRGIARRFGLDDLNGVLGADTHPPTSRREPQYRSYNPDKHTPETGTLI